MRVSRVNPCSFGILRNVKVHHYPIGSVKVYQGETKKSFITIFKEYIGKNLDLKFYLIKSKGDNKTKSRLLHIYNGKIVFKLER